MDIKPDPNPDDEKAEIVSGGNFIGGDYISITGNTGPASTTGRGSTTSHYVAGQDMVLNGKASGEEADFGDLLARLNVLTIEAYKSGELNEQAARKIVTSLKEAAKLASQDGNKAPRSEIMQKLQYVADVLEAAVDFLSSSGGVAKVLLQALPIAALLIKVATRIF
jgi:hypothetical protein